MSKFIKVNVSNAQSIELVNIDCVVAIARDGEHAKLFLDRQNHYVTSCSFSELLEMLKSIEVLDE